MKAMRITKRTAALALVAMTVLGAGAYAWADNQPQDPQVTTAQPQQQNAPQRPLRHRPGFWLLRRAVHGDLIVRDRSRQWVTVQYDRGTLTAKGDHSLTIRRPDGKTVTVKVDDATRYRGVDGFDALQTGKPLVVVGKDGVATVVAQRAGNAGVRPGVGNDEGQVPAA